MARLPGERFLLQQIGGKVVLFEDYTERTIAVFDPCDDNDTDQAQGIIRLTPELNDEEKAFAHFWSGYFCSYTGHRETEMPGDRCSFREEGNLAVLSRDGEIVVSFNPAGGNDAAQAQLSIHESTGLTGEEKAAAHFWSGYFYGKACQ